MNYLIAISIVFFIAGLIPHSLVQAKGKPYTTFLESFLSYSFLVICWIIGMWFFCAGLLKFVEVDLRGKTVKEVQQEYNRIYGGAK